MGVTSHVPSPPLPPSGDSSSLLGLPLSSPLHGAGTQAQEQGTRPPRAPREMVSEQVGGLGIGVPAQNTMIGENEVETDRGCLARSVCQGDRDQEGKGQGRS